MHGEMVKQQLLRITNEAHTTVEMDDLVPGVYQLCLQQKNLPGSIQRFVKR